MTQSPHAGAVPEFTLGDRLGKALRYGDVSASDMALYLDVHRNTISAYVNDRQPVKGGTLRLWALRTGVSMEWLEHGVGTVGPPGPDGGGLPVGETTQPTDLDRLTAQKAARTRATRRGAPSRRYVAAA